MDVGRSILQTRPLRLMLAVVAEARRDRLLGLAAEVAFFAIFSVFPGLLLVVGLLGYLDVLAGADVAAEARSQAVRALDAVLTDEAAPVIASVESVFEGHYGGLVTGAAAGALVTLSGAWAVLIEAINHAYDIEDLRSWWRRRFLGLVLGLATMVVVVVTLAVLVVGPLLGYGRNLASPLGLNDELAQAWTIVRLPLLFVFVAGWLTVVFRVAPHRHSRWRDAAPGAVATTALWLVGTVGFNAYLSLVGDRNPLLGAFGGGVIVMSWAYLLSISILLGGELNAVLARGRDGTGSSATS